MLLIVRI